MNPNTQIGARELDWFKHARRGEAKRQRMLVRAVQEALPANTSSNKILILESDLALARKKTRMPRSRNKYADIWDARHGRLSFPKRILEQIPEGKEFRIDQIDQDAVKRMITDGELNLEEAPKNSGGCYYVLSIQKAVRVPNFSELTSSPRINPGDSN